MGGGTSGINIVSGAILGFLAIYFAFKSKQAAGAYRRNKIATNYGKGSFSSQIKYFVLGWFWTALAVSSGIGAFASLDSGKNNLGQKANAEQSRIDASKALSVQDSLPASTTGDISPQKDQDPPSKQINEQTNGNQIFSQAAQQNGETKTQEDSLNTNQEH